MMKTLSFLAVLLTAGLQLGGCTLAGGGDRVVGGDARRGDNQSAYGIGVPAQYFEGLGDYRRPVTTTSPLTQQYFDQGLVWMYGFNHDEAVRSFTKAAELDPACAMAWWGVAYAQGPNYNAPAMNKARREAAWQAMHHALARLDNATPAERALILALKHRYEDPARPDPNKNKHGRGEAPQDEATHPPAGRSQTQCKADFAQAMARAYAAHPDDPEIGTLYADAMMVMHPWRLWKPDGSAAREQTHRIVDTLEAVLARHPRHPGANHLYIHAVEAGNDKHRGLAAAEVLCGLVPASGHLQHMPAHLFVQTGQWQRAVAQSLRAIEADRAYLAKSPMQFRQHAYIAHNAHMLAFAAMMTGQEALAMSAANAARDLPPEVFDQHGQRYDGHFCARYEVLRRFGRWDALLAEPAPPPKLKQATAVWRSCRAIAFAAQKDDVNARAEQAAFRVLLAQKPDNVFLKLTDHFVAAELALQQADWDQAIGPLKRAIEIEDSMRYIEPPRWTQPVRHTLGAVYLQSERYQDAEQAYREDLNKWPENGWSLLGLARALAAQGKRQEAQATLEQFERSWSHADEPLATSCKCIPALPGA